MGDTPGSPTISTKLQRIAKQAACYPDMVFDNLYHLLDVEFLRQAYQLTRKDSAPGVDKVTAKQYVAELEANLRDLHERLVFNRYVAPPVERVWIEAEMDSVAFIAIVLPGTVLKMGRKHLWRLRHDIASLLAPDIRELLTRRRSGDFDIGRTRNGS